MGASGATPSWHPAQRGLVFMSFYEKFKKWIPFVFLATRASSGKGHKTALFCLFGQFHVFEKSCKKNKSNKNMVSGGENDKGINFLASSSKLMRPRRGWATKRRCLVFLDSFMLVRVSIKSFKHVFPLPFWPTGPPPGAAQNCATLSFWTVA